MSIEEAIWEFTSLSRYYKDSGNVKDAVDHEQIANWLQELKERREKESRKIPQDMTEEACEVFIYLTQKIIEILPDIIASVTANMSNPWCKFRSEKNCDFCAFHSDCEIHWKDGEQ